MNKKIILLFVFLIFLPIETSIEIGGARLSPIRIFLIAFLCFNFKKIFFERQLMKSFVAWSIILFCFCVILAFVVNHDLSVGLKSGGVLALEFLGAFALGYKVFRSSLDFLYYGKLSCLVVFFLVLLSIPEIITGSHYLRELFGSITGNYYDINHQYRSGFLRPLVTFEHPILFGMVICLFLPFCLVYFNIKKKNYLIPFFLVSPLAALSSAPIMCSALVGSGFIYFKTRLSRIIRLKVLGFLSLFLFVFLEIFSNSGVLSIVFRYLTFDPQTGYFRLLIWEYAMNNVWDNPIFGLGFNNWDRPSWMPGSIDSFWLVLAVKYGLPAPLLIISVFFYCIYKGVKSILINKDYNKTIYIAFTVLFFSSFFVGMTVHFWGASQILIFFYIGAFVKFHKSVLLSNRKKKSIKGML